jgi:basic membrane protein A
MHRLAIWASVAALILGFAFGPALVERIRCVPGQEPEPEALQIALLHYGPIEDAGWTYQGHVAAERLAETFPWIALEEVEDTPSHGGADFVRDYAEEGYDLILTHGWGSDFVPELAADYPDVIFMCGGAHGRPAENVGTYYGRTHEARYLAGMVAGRMTESGLVGYAPSYPLPRVIAGVNAFARGVAETNPDATVEIAWVNEWYAPEREAEAIAELVAKGCDVVTHDSDSFASAEAAEENGVLYIASHDRGMQEYAPSVYLTALDWNWIPLFSDIVSAVRDGTWDEEADNGWWYGLPEGCITLAPMTDLVPEAVQDEVLARRDEILRGEFIVFPEFTDEDLWQITTFEPNVSSNLPEE